MQLATKDKTEDEKNKKRKNHSLINKYFWVNDLGPLSGR